jgi:phosphoribosylformimino-5-aminoimidazole carboxamide ribotide isomerase
LPRLVGELLVEGGSVVRRRIAPGAPGRLVAADPVQHARDLVDEGVGVLALTVVDGERLGAPQALREAAAIAALGGVELWYRGGLESPAAVESARAAGVACAVLAAGALRDAAFLRWALDSLGPHVAVALDAEGMRVASPITEGAETSLVDAAGELAFRGVGALLVTDRARAGTLAGPNLRALRALLAVVQCQVSYAGGVATVDDLRALRALGRATLHGVLVATAFNESRFAPSEAVEVLEQGA